VDTPATRLLSFTQQVSNISGARLPSWKGWEAGLDRAPAAPGTGMASILLGDAAIMAPPAAGKFYFSGSRRENQGQDIMAD
jgi:hypothetical protein